MLLGSRESGVAGITDGASEGVGARPGGGAVSGGDPGLPVRSLRSRRLLLRTLRLRSRDVNVPKTPRPERRPRLAASARRAQLVEVGRKVFAERGYEATSGEEIAERAGTSKPILYEDFGGKEGPYAGRV